MDMVSVRQVRVEAQPKPPAKQKKSKKKESVDPDQPTFFDETNLEQFSQPSPAPMGRSKGSQPAQPIGGFDLTFPKLPLTGHERSLADLTQPDQRSISCRLDLETLQAPYLAVENRLPTTIPTKLRERISVARNLAVYGFFCYEFHAVSMFWSISCVEMALKLKFEEMNPGPFQLRRKLYSAREEETCVAALCDLEEKIRMNWRIVDLTFFNYGFKSLLMWAFRKSLLPENIEIPVQEIVNSYNNRFALTVFPRQAQEDGLLGQNPTLGDIKACWDGLSDRQRKHYCPKASTVLTQELPRLRNIMAHPEQFNLVLPPASPLSAFQLLTNIVIRLWPVALPVASH
jgi:hypothetical protein